MSTDAERQGAPAAGRRAADPRARLRPAAPYLLLVGGWLAAYPFTRHYVNPDGTSYVVVAELWLTGQWPAAVNAYWGPLLSWLMAPLMLLGVPGLLALRLVLLGGALFCLPALRSLARRAGASEAATDVALLVCAPFLVYAALFGTYPDVLLVAALLRCCDHLFRPEFATSTRTALAAGAWGGVAYLAKAYAVPVVLVLLPVAVLVHRASTGALRTGPLLRRGGAALAAFAVVFAGWAGVLSASYGEPTFSTSAGFNSRLVASGSAGNPLNHPGLYPPVREGALSVWEEPSRLEIPVRDRAVAATEDSDPDGTAASDPDGAAGSLTHRVETAVANARIIAGSVVRRGLPLALPALVALGWFAYRRRAPSPALTGPLLAGAISAGGLVLIIAIERYVWFAILACLPAAAVGLDIALRRHRRALPLVGAVLVAVMAAGSLHGLLPRWNTEREVTVAAEQLNRDGGLDAAVATTGDENWGPTLQLCLQVGCQYLGRPEARDAATAAGELRAAGVDYLVAWHGGSEQAAQGEAVTGLPDPGGPGVLTLYAVTPSGLVLDRRVGEGATT